MKLNDMCISHIAKLVQLAILTGTDIVDNLRQMELSQENEQSLMLEPEYSKLFDENLNKMMESILSSASSGDLNLE
jgi:hypothetical protein